MATYLQGVTDYIPEFQPFQPDLNFYANVLQTKQTQYDTNWKALNKIYGQYFYSDLSREDNIQIKDELLKNIDFNLKRISGLDLSLEQNVEQAAQVFKPFYEDKYLMKDMAYTKNYLNQRSRGTSLKNSKELQDREQYWDQGIKALDYRREEFREVSREESLNFASSTYTPYVNSFDKFAKIAKEWGISADITTPDASGMYMIRQKNGDQIIAPLQTLFQSYAGNDAQLQEVYFTQAYVNRKDAVYQNAQKFNGDMNASEIDYLNQASKTISDYAAKRKAEATALASGISNEIERVNDVVSKNEDNIFTNAYLDRLNQSAGYADAAADATEKVDKEVNGGNVTDATTGGSFRTDDDIETLRRKVDAGIASMLMDSDIAKAAYSYSRRDMKYEMKESQAGLESIRQKNRLAAIAAKQKADEWNIKVKHNLDSGIWLLDEAGNIYPKDLSFYNPNALGIVDEAEVTADESEKRDIEDENKYQMDETARTYANDWVEAAYTFVKAATEKNLIPKNKQGSIFSLDFSDKGYLSSREAGRDVLNQAGEKTVSTGKSILSKLAKGFGIDQRVDQFFGQDAGNSFRTWLDKDDTKSKDPSAKQEDGTITKMLDAIGVTKALGKLYYQSPDEFLDDYKKDPASFLYGNAESLGLIKAKVDALAGMMRGDGSIGDNYILATAQSGQKMDQFVMHSNAVKAINFHNEDIIQSALSGSLGVYSAVGTNTKISKDLATAFYDGTNIATEEDFINSAKLILKNVNQSRQLPKSVSGSGWVKEAYNALTPTEKKELDSILTAESNKIKYPKGVIGAGIKYPNLSRRSQFIIIQDYLGKKFNLGTLDGTSKLKSMYNDLMTTYSKVVKDPNKIQILTPLLQEVNQSGGRAGVYSKGESGVEVHLGAPSTFKPFVEFIQNDLRNIKLGDINTTGISVLGTTKTGFDKTKELTIEDGGAQRDMLYRMVNDLYSEMRQGSKVKPFRFTQRQVAAGNRNLAAMVIYPDKEFLDKYKAGKDEPGLTADVINNALSYGVSVIAPRQNFTNSLFTQNQWTPMQIAVKGSPNKMVTLNNPYGAGQVKISEVKMGPGDYNIEFISHELKPNGEIKTLSTTFPNLVYGNNLDNQAQRALNELMMVSAQNNNIYQTLSPELKKKVSQSGVFKNVPVSMMPILENAWATKNIQMQLNKQK